MKRNKNKLAGNHILFTIRNKCDKRTVVYPQEILNLAKQCGLVSPDDDVDCDYTWYNDVFLRFAARRGETPEGLAYKTWLFSEALFQWLEDLDDPEHHSISVFVTIGKWRTLLFEADAKTGVDFLPRK